MMKAARRECPALRHALTPSRRKVPDSQLSISALADPLGHPDLPPCDQIVERVNVWPNAEGNPTDGAPKNNSVITHRDSPH